MVLTYTRTSGSFVRMKIKIVHALHLVDQSQEADGACQILKSKPLVSTPESPSRAVPLPMKRPSGNCLLPGHNA